MKTTVVDYGNGIHAIFQEMVRAFLIIGTDKALLLDTGACEIDIWKYIQEITTLPVQVILTHGDIDHITNLHQFSEVYLNEAEIEAVQNHPGCKDMMLHKLSEGDAFDIGGRTLQVLLTPGHTEGSICLLDKEHGILFSGDTVSYGPVFMFGKGRNPGKYLESLQRLRSLRDAGSFHTIYCCHNECPIVGEVIDDLIECVKGTMDKTLPMAPVTLPMPTDENVCIVKYGKSAILVSNEGEEGRMP